MLHTHMKPTTPFRLWTAGVALAGLLVAGFAVNPAQAQTPDGETPSSEVVCDHLEGKLLDLCESYCEAMDCDLDLRLMQSRSCSRLLRNYARASEGALPPCIDGDNDGCHDEIDGCPGTDDAELCGVDTDHDAVDDMCDDCPNDPNKVVPGDCGCGVADTDSDGDGTADCNDACPNDPDKVTPGTCGCGVSDAGVLQCPAPTGPGICVEACSAGSCSGGQLCCFNGCGHVCTDPVSQCPTG